MRCWPLWRWLIFVLMPMRPHCQKWRSAQSGVARGGPRKDLCMRVDVDDRPLLAHVLVIAMNEVGGIQGRMFHV